ncbi:unknown [Bacteroides sp. CAG:633]|nr:unknown [Bacteroides sp. CAG:633]
MKTKNLNFNRRSTHYIFSFILERCNYEKKDVIKIE